MTDANWVNHVENIGATCPLKELQEAICACPESLYASPLYIYLCGSLMARALDTEDITQIDLTKAPYEGAGAIIATVWPEQSELPFEENTPAANWITYIDNVGIAFSLKELQEAICACPESLYDSPLYIFLCGSLMARALDAEDITQIDLTKAPYEGAGAIKTILEFKHKLSFKEAASNYGS